MGGFWGFCGIQLKPWVVEWFNKSVTSHQYSYVKKNIPFSKNALVFHHLPIRFANQPSNVLGFTNPVFFVEITRSLQAEGTMDYYAGLLFLLVTHNIYIYIYIYICLYLEFAHFQWDVQPALAKYWSCAESSMESKRNKTWKKLKPKACRCWA